MATALVTGASAGLGEEFAWQLATAGHDLVLVARRREVLHEIASHINGATGVTVEVLAADLADHHHVTTVAARVASANHPVSLLVNNAGFGIGQPFTSSTVADELRMLDVMVRAPLELTHAAIPAMRSRGHGAILNVASVAAYLANSTYAAHKRWLLDFTHAVAAQLDGTGVTATALVPGLVHTEFHDSEELSHYRTTFPDMAWLSSEQVVTAALAGVRRGSVVVTPSARYAAVTSLMKVIPAAWKRGRATLDRR